MSDAETRVERIGPAMRAASSGIAEGRKFLHE